MSRRLLKLRDGFQSSPIQSDWVKQKKGNHHLHMILSKRYWDGKREFMIAEALSEALRGVMIQALVDQMKEEVVTLCGPHYHPAAATGHRWSALARRASA